MGKYEEALERAKAGKPIDEVFPELKESEDERIRKAIVKMLSDIDGGYPFEKYGIFKKNALAYLEKQKERKPVEIHIDNPNIQQFDPDVKVTTSDSSASGKELLYVCNKSYNIGYRDGVNSVKPAEWSEEDERMLEPIISDLRELCNCETDEELISDYEDRIAWLKSLRPQPHWKPNKEQMDILDKVYHYLWADRNATADMQDGLGDFIDEIKSL